MFTFHLYLYLVWFEWQDVELEELVRREKMGGDDMDAEFARNIVRLGSRFRGTEQRTGYVAFGCMTIVGWVVRLLYHSFVFIY
jgi:hypothetical protein